MRPVQKQKVASISSQPTNKFILRVDSEPSPELENKRIAVNANHQQDLLAAEIE